METCNSGWLYIIVRLISTRRQKVSQPNGPKSRVFGRDIDRKLWFAVEFAAGVGLAVGFAVGTRFAVHLDRKEMVCGHFLTANDGSRSALRTENCKAVDFCLGTPNLITFSKRATITSILLLSHMS